MSISVNWMKREGASAAKCGWDMRVLYGTSYDPPRKQTAIACFKQHTQLQAIKLFRRNNERTKERMNTLPFIYASVAMLLTDFDHFECM